MVVHKLLEKSLSKLYNKQGTCKVQVILNPKEAQFMGEKSINSNLDKLEQLRTKREHILQMGGHDAIERRHKKGQMSARERIDYFFDPNTFNEIGLFVKHRTTAFGMDQKEVPAEGVITGHGKVNGRHVVVAAEDFTSMAGSFGEYHGKKFVRAIEFAKEQGWPFVGMNDSGGARLQEGMDCLEAYGDRKSVV